MTTPAEQVKAAKTKLNNAVKTIKKCNSEFIKDGLNKGLDILFFDNGNDFKFGIESHYSFQIKSGLVKNKTDVLIKLQLEKDYVSNYASNMGLR